MIMAKEYIVSGIEMSAKELIDYAEMQYGCQRDKSLRFTSVAARELRKRGHKVKEIKQ